MAKREERELDVGMLRKPDAPRAVAELLDGYTDVVEQRQQQVRQRRAGRLDATLTAAQPPRAPADDGERQVEMSVQVWITERAAVQEHRVIEQRAVAFRRRSKLTQERREQIRLIRVELRVALDVLGLLLVMRHRVMPLREPDLRVSAEVELAPEHERVDAREVRALREPLKLVHELHVHAEGFRNSGGAIERGLAG